MMGINNGIIAMFLLILLALFLPLIMAIGIGISFKILSPFYDWQMEKANDLYEWWKKIREIEEE